MNSHLFGSGRESTANLKGKCLKLFVYFYLEIL